MSSQFPHYLTNIETDEAHPTVGGLMWQGQDQYLRPSVWKAYELGRFRLGNGCFTHFIDEDTKAWGINQPVLDLSAGK